MEFDSPGDPYSGTKDVIEKTIRYLPYFLYICCESLSPSC